MPYEAITKSNMKKWWLKHLNSIKYIIKNQKFDEEESELESDCDSGVFQLGNSWVLEGF